MVYYFTSNVVDPPAQIYVGKDKVENEDLIAYGLEEDVWVCLSSLSPTHHLGALDLDLAARQATHDLRTTLNDKSGASSGTTITHKCSPFHVDNLSSAHIYYRLQPGQTWDAIPKDILEDCAQLTKANSIEGNKKDNVTIIYTPWFNLKKDGSMATGQVGFKDQKKVKKIHIPQRENHIVNRLNKTRVEKFPDLRKEKDDYLRELRKKDQEAQRKKQKEEARTAKERKELAWQRDHAYDDIHSPDAIAASSNQDRDEDFFDDFM